MRRQMEDPGTTAEPRDALRRLIALRQHAEATLPIERSALAHDLIMLLADCDAQNKPPTVKQLLLGLPFSPAGVRLHLRKLAAKGWVREQPDAQDLRVRRILITEKLRLALQTYASRAEQEWQMSPRLRDQHTSGLPCR
jgi:DNA-binding MarR family transcriptional regulator